MPKTLKSPPSDKRFSKKVIVLLVVLILIIAIGAATVGATMKDSPFFRANKLSSQEKEAEDLVSRVGKLIVLPQGKATIATVSDKSQLAGQPFFNNAENGDQVLIYTESKKAILYRPSINKIIEVGPVIAEVTPTVIPSPSVSVTPPKKK